MCLTVQPTESTPKRKPQRAAEFLSVAEAAEIVGVGIGTVLDALQHGELQGKNFRGRRGWMTTRSALVRWIEGGNQRR